MTQIFSSHTVTLTSCLKKMNKELTNVSNLFNANKLSLNVKKNKYYFFHKSSKKDNIPLHLLNLNINGLTVERESSITFGLLYQGKLYLDENCLKQNYFAYIHAYLRYANIAWGSTHKTKLKKVQSKQKLALRIIFNQSKTSPSEPYFLNLNVLNVYQINIFQSVQFIHEKKITPYTVSMRGSILWNNCLSKNEKEFHNLLLFKQRIKKK